MSARETCGQAVWGAVWQARIALRESRLDEASASLRALEAILQEWEEPLRRSWDSAWLAELRARAVSSVLRECQTHEQLEAVAATGVVDAASAGLVVAMCDAYSVQEMHVRWLLARGCSVNAPVRGRRPLHVARTAKAVDMLVALGADVDALDVTENSALACALAELKTFSSWSIGWARVSERVTALLAHGASNIRRSVRLPLPAELHGLQAAAEKRVAERRVWQSVLVLVCAMRRQQRQRRQRQRQAALFLPDELLAMIAQEY